MTVDTAAPALAATTRNVMDRIRYMVLGTIDEDGCTRTSPVYFVPHRYRNPYWVSTPTSHHSPNLKRDNRLSAVIFDSTHWQPDRINQQGPLSEANTAATTTTTALLGLHLVAATVMIPTLTRSLRSRTD